MKQLSICYCKAHDYSHVHLNNGQPDTPNRAEIEDELRRLRPYERAVVAWERAGYDGRWGTLRDRMHRLAAASVRRSKKVRR